MIQKDYNVPAINQVEAARAEAERRALAAGNAQADAERRAAELSSRLAAVLPPEGDDAVLAQLQTQIDALHAAGVAREARSLLHPKSSNNRANYRQYRSYAHKAFTSSPVPSLTSVTVAYHRQCSICDRNFGTRLKIDAIRERQAREAKARREMERQTPTYLQKGGLS